MQASRIKPSALALGKQHTQKQARETGDSSRIMSSVAHRRGLEICKTPTQGFANASPWALFLRPASRAKFLKAPLSETPS